MDNGISIYIVWITHVYPVSLLFKENEKKTEW